VPWNRFSHGVADRGASIRVPHSFVRDGYGGYPDDRRPNPEGDPYPDRLTDPEDDLGSAKARRSPAGPLRGATAQLRLAAFFQSGS
jgi:hypothetical protein